MVGSRQRLALDLFSGTGSVKKALEARGWTVIAVDLETKFNPDVAADIGTWDFRKTLPRSKWNFDLIAASPPCTEYSSAMTRRPRRMLEADGLVRRSLEIIKYYKPRIWWVENPRHGNLRWRQVVQGLAYIDLDYCKFSDWGYRKATRFWVPRWLAEQRRHVICGMDCENIVKDEKGYMRHRVQIGMHQRVEDVRQDTRTKLYRIPDEIIGYLTGEDGRHNKMTVDAAVMAELSSRSVREITIKSYHHIPNFMIGLMENRDGGHQLLMHVVLEAGGVVRHARALVDTGAQVSLIRTGLLPDEVFQPARRPLALKTASGEPLQGGQRVATLQVEFAAETEGGVRTQTPWKTDVAVHDGDIGVDVILGYPWLRRQRVDVQPWRNALQLHDPPRWVLRAQSARATATVLAQRGEETSDVGSDKTMEEDTKNTEVAPVSAIAVQVEQEHQQGDMDNNTEVWIQ